MPFHIALNCPDTLFYPFFESGAASPRLRDFWGNSVLFPALIHDLAAGTKDRYRFLLERGYGPDEKNRIGFSCNDVLAFYPAEDRPDPGADAKNFGLRRQLP